MHIAKRLYGEKCEICGWAEATTDVHHMDYLDREDEKDERTDNYAVLCPNHHRWVHDNLITKDMLLIRIKPRIRLNHVVRRLLEKC